MFRASTAILQTKNALEFPFFVNCWWLTALPARHFCRNGILRFGLSCCSVQWQPGPSYHLLSFWRMCLLPHLVEHCSSPPVLNSVPDDSLLNFWKSQIKWQRPWSTGETPDPSTQERALHHCGHTTAKPATAWNSHCGGRSQTNIRNKTFVEELIVSVWF